ncbi:MAG: type IV pilus assembly protein PilV [Zhongshania sp.]|jgi:type IV pilus assembly protein PilV
MLIMRQEKRLSRGFTLIEVLVAMVVLLVGVMGAAGLMVRTVQQEVEAYQRLQALNILQEMTDRMNANRGVVSCYSYGNTGATFGVGVTESDFTVCGSGSANERAMVATDIMAWNNLLNGVAEQLDTNNTGAMVGARGCIVQLSAAENQYRITVAWQGMNETVAPVATNTCGKDQYGSEKQRRVISTIVRMGILS